MVDLLEFLEVIIGFVDDLLEKFLIKSLFIVYRESEEFEIDDIDYVFVIIKMYEKKGNLVNGNV